MEYVTDPPIRPEDRSRDAFEACQYGVNRLKNMTALKKSEVFAD